MLFCFSLLFIRFVWLQVVQHDYYQTRAEGLGKKAGITRIAVTEFSESHASSPAARMGDEAKLIAAALPQKAFSIVLDERGKAMASEAFAQTLQRHLDGGTQDLAFLIGGPDGHATACLLYTSPSPRDRTRSRMPSSA